MKCSSVVILCMLMLPLTSVSAAPETIRSYHFSFEQPFTYGLLSGATLFLYPQHEAITNRDLMPTRGEVPLAYVKHVKHHVKPMVYLGTAIGLMLPLTLLMCIVSLVRGRLTRSESQHVQEM